MWQPAKIWIDPDSEHYFRNHPILAFSQASVKFSIGLKPNSMYSELIIQKIKMEISLDSSSAAVIARMDSNGKKKSEGAGAKYRDRRNNAGALSNRTSKMPVIFHLKSIEGNTAFFETKAEFRLDMEMKNLPITGSGSGEGIMEYDLANHYPTKNTLSYILHLGIYKEELVMHIDMNASMKNTCRIQSL